MGCIVCESQKVKVINLIILNSPTHFAREAHPKVNGFSAVGVVSSGGHFIAVTLYLWLIPESICVHDVLH